MNISLASAFLFDCSHDAWQTSNARSNEFNVCFPRLFTHIHLQRLNNSTTLSQCLESLVCVLFQSVIEQIARHARMYSWEVGRKPPWTSNMHPSDTYGSIQLYISSSRMVALLVHREDARWMLGVVIRPTLEATCLANWSLGKIENTHKAVQ